jgi:transcription elongation factor GreA-like protein
MSRLLPGAYVRHPDRPDWGVGQVQSVIGQRITVNFENAGKLLINGAVITLEPLDDTDNPEQ